METDSDFEDGSAADVDAPAPEDDTGTSGAVGYDKDAGDAIHNGHVHYVPRCLSHCCTVMRRRRLPSRLERVPILSSISRHGLCRH
mmetsp:Transcript_14949/g.33708  ORF Transcript_14949/g.33708 Transcript_14949/m.33708 type:complete len:86 (+) Transcript_14949:143-400(+)